MGPVVTRRLCLLSLIFTGAIVLTGAAVRLTGSGLGCADWPDCMQGHLTPPLQFHSLIEFGNRMVTIALVVVVGATLLAVLDRRPFRRDLTWLSLGLIAGVVLEAVLGGVLIYTKLNPYVLLVHFLVTMLLLVDAAVLEVRSRHDTASAGTLSVPPAILWLSRGLLCVVSLVIAAGAATTGAAPDAGGAVGQLVAKRIPVSLRDLAELHATMALFCVGLVLALAVSLHAIDVPERVRKAARILVLVLVFQGAIGYIQYFTHLPAGVVELHELGVTVLVIGLVHYHLSLTRHAPVRASALRRATALGLGAEAQAGLGIQVGVGAAPGAGATAGSVLGVPHGATVVSPPDTRAPIV